MAFLKNVIFLITFNVQIKYKEKEVIFRSEKFRSFVDE